MTKLTDTERPTAVRCPDCQLVELRTFNGFKVTPEAFWFCRTCGKKHYVKETVGRVR